MHFDADAREAPRYIEDASHPAHRTARWVALGVLCAISSLVTGGLIATLSLYALVIDQVEHWGTVTLGIAGTLLLLCLSLAGIGAGYALERVKARLVIGVGALLTAAGCWLAGSAHSVPLFWVGFALIGAGAAAATTVASIPLITSYFHHKRGLGLGIYFAAMAGAAAALPLLVSDLIVQWGWRVTLHGTGAVVASSCLLLPFLSQPTAIETATDGVSDNAGLTVRQAFRTGDIWALTGAIILAQLSIQAVLFTAVSYLSGEGYTMAQAVAIYSCANLFSVPAGIITGALADRLSAARVLPIGLWVQVVGTLAIVGAFVGGIAGWLALGLFVVGWGISSSIQIQIGPMLMRDLTGGRHFAAILSYALAAVGLIGAMAPLMSSAVEKWTGDYVLLFVICGILSGLAALLTMGIRRRVLTR
jgi:MFS family permease